jgi:hypothetical protein
MRHSGKYRLELSGVRFYLGTLARLGIYGCLLSGYLLMNVLRSIWAACLSDRTDQEAGAPGHRSWPTITPAEQSVKLPL